MSRIIKCGLIQARNIAPIEMSIDEIKKQNIENQMEYVEAAAKQGVQAVAGLVENVKDRVTT